MNNMNEMDLLFQSFLNGFDNSEKLLILKNFANHNKLEYSDVLDAILNRLKSFDQKMGNAKISFPVSINNFIDEATYYNNLERVVCISIDAKAKYTLGEHEINKNLISSEIINEYLNISKLKKSSNEENTDNKPDLSKTIALFIPDFINQKDEKLLNDFFNHGKSKSLIPVKKNVGKFIAIMLSIQVEIPKKYDISIYALISNNFSFKDKPISKTTINSVKNPSKT